MSNIIRSPKSGSDWTENELIAYNIVIENKDEENFFGGKAERISPQVSSDFINFNFETGDELEDHDDLLTYLDMASRAQRGQESMVDDFARELLVLLGFKSRGRIVRTRHTLRLVICGSNRTAQTDVCLIRKKGELLLLIQEDKRLVSIKDPEPQVIAEAIASFQENNRIRSDEGIDPIDRMVIPCITMIGSFPRFYLVPVTKELSTCVISGTYPENTTRVLKHVPRVPRRISEGMKPVENRKKIIQCYESFKKFVNDLDEELF